MRILVAGLINIETTLRVDSFPVAYEPVRYPFFGVRSTVSGVGMNVACALTRLGHEVRLLSMVGRDPSGAVARAEVKRCAGDDSLVLATLEETPQSVILYEPSGRRQIHVDLKNIQETPLPNAAERALDDADIAVLCNINFSRPLLSAARARALPIATDVHALSDLDDEYNRDYIDAADILFMSHEKLPVSPPEWLERIAERARAEVIAVGCGVEGAWAFDRAQAVTRHVPSCSTRPVVSTIGAGDAFFSTFLDGRLRGMETFAALRRAAVHASWKIGEKGAAEGLLDAVRLAEVCAEAGIASPR